MAEAGGYTGAAGPDSYQQIRGYAKAGFDVYASYVSARLIDGGAQQKYSYGYGVRAEAAFRAKGGADYAKAAAQGYLGSNPGNSWVWVAGGITSGAVTIARTGSAQVIEVVAQAFGATVSGYGSFPGQTGWQVVGSYTIPALDLPTAPASVEATVNAANKITVSWAWSAGGTHANSFDIFRSVDGGTYVNIGSVVGSSRSYADTTTSVNHTYYYQVRAWNARGFSGASNTASARTATAPAAPSGVTNTRQSDNQNVVSWTRNETSLGAYSQVLLDRSIDGGAWSRVATLTGSATSWVDTSTQANHSYAYRICATNIAGASGWVATVTTYNTPAAPGAPTASRTSASGVQITFANPATTETATEWMRSTDKTNWSAPVSLSGANITSFVDAPGGGTFYYVVRNTRGSLVSGWSAASNAVLTITAPSAPTLLQPFAGGVFFPAEDPQQFSAPTITFRWQHNPIDGSAQTAAELRCSTDGGSTWTSTAIGGSVSTYGLKNTFAVNSTVTWQMRTRGAHADFGPRSGTQTFRVCRAPQIAITSPGVLAEIDAMPLEIAWDYSDDSGSQASAAVSIREDTEAGLGPLAFRRDIEGDAHTTTVTSADFLPENGKTYLIEVLAISTSSLNVGVSIIVTVGYDPPVEAVCDVAIDTDRASVAIYVAKGEEQDAPATVSLGVFRRREDGTLLSLGDGLTSGAAVDDPYPPTDTELVYLIVAYTESGLSSQVEHTATLPSRGITLFNFGDGHKQMTGLGLRTGQGGGDSWAPTHSVEFFETAGSGPPLAFYGPQEELTGSLAGAVPTHSGILEAHFGTLSEAQALVRYAGPVVMRRPGWPVLCVDVTLSFAKILGADFAEVSVGYRQVRAYGMAL
ncbi:MAG: hypothetical protein LBU07_05125 [Coriobacteriales bacterium]|jgi:hypothetical protein|nr:hypothetical protein [Coriobacteriales bacterium]